MPCIFCLLENPPSDEHVFPKAIGGNKIIRNVCTDCNSKLGSNVDVKLTNHPAIISKRYALGMKDSEGRFLNPMAGWLYTGRLASDPNQKIQMSMDLSSGEVKPYLIYNQISSNLHDSHSDLEVRIDASDIDKLPRIVNRHRARRGLDPLSDAQINEIKLHLLENIQTIENPEVIYEIEIDPTEHYRPIFKIAYELAYEWLGTEYLTDPLAELIRDFVLGKSSEIDCRVSFDPNADQIFQFWKQEPNNHLAFLQKHNSQISIAIRIFDFFSFVILISNDGLKYSNAPSGGFIAICLDGAELRESTLADEISRLAYGLLQRCQ